MQLRSQRMTSALLTVVALAGSAFLANPAVAQTTTKPSYSLTTVLPLPPDAKGVKPTAINNNGQVVGRTTSTGTKTFLGWVWNRATGKSTSLPALSASFPRSGAMDVNDAGCVAGKSYVSDYSSSSDGQATLWLPNQYLQYGKPISLNDPTFRGPWLPGWVLREARAVSNPISSTDPANPTYYVVCTGDRPDPTTGVMTAGGYYGAVCTINKSGFIVGAAAVAFPADKGTTDPWFDLQDVNNQGQVLGDYWSGAGTTADPWKQWGCIWDASNGGERATVAELQVKAINSVGGVIGMKDMPVKDSAMHQGHYVAPTYLTANPQPLPAGFNANGDPYQSIPYDLSSTQYNAEGVLVRPLQVVGQGPEWGTYLAYIWQEEAPGQFSYYRLQDCAPYLRGMTLKIGEAINDSGSIICSGTLSNVSRAFLLTR